MLSKGFGAIIFNGKGCKEGAHLLEGMHPTKTPIPTGIEGKRGAGGIPFYFFNPGNTLSLHDR